MSGEERSGRVVAHGEIVEAQYQVAAAGHVAQVEAQRAVLLCSLYPLQPRQPLLPPLCLTAALAGDVAADEIFSAGNGLLLPLVLCLLEGYTLGLLDDVGAIVAAIPLQPAPFHFPHPLDDAVEEGAVVGYDEHCALPRLEIVLQPLDARQVEVVSWLVHQQQVGLFQQEAGQQGARFLSSAELR